MDEKTTGMYRFGLVGWPLSMSLSPRVHALFFRYGGIAGEYGLYPVPPEDFEERLSMLLEEGIDGLNVTCPYKMRAASVCGRIVSDTAVPVVNTLLRREGVILGFNTDVTGFRKMRYGMSLCEPFFVVGSGGAALAVDGALRLEGSECTVFCREPGKWKGFGPAMDLESLEAVLRKNAAGTVVNATTLGWFDDDPFPLKPDLLRNRTFVDLNYNPGWKFRNDLRGTSERVLTGEAMLVYQAAEAFRLWTGIRPDVRRCLADLEIR